MLVCLEDKRRERRPTFPLHAHSYTFLKSTVATSTAEVSVDDTLAIEATSELLVTENGPTEKALAAIATDDLQKESGGEEGRLTP